MIKPYYRLVIYDDYGLKVLRVMIFQPGLSFEWNKGLDVPVTTGRVVVEYVEPEDKP